MNKFKISATTVPTEADKPLHHKEITSITLDEGISETFLDN